MRITWFGNNCFRVAFGDQQFAFYPQNAPKDVSISELTATAHMVDEVQAGPFLPYDGQLKRISTGRLIDDMETGNSYFRLEGLYVFDAPPDERLIFIEEERGDTLNKLSSEIKGAVVLISACFEDVLRCVVELRNLNAKQLLLAISDPSNLDMQDLAQNAGKQRLQLLEHGLAIEL